jgi:hypothetical protein
MGAQKTNRRPARPIPTAEAAQAATRCRIEREAGIEATQNRKQRSLLKATRRQGVDMRSVCRVSTVMCCILKFGPECNGADKPVTIPLCAEVKVYLFLSARIETHFWSLWVGPWKMPREQPNKACRLFFGEDLGRIRSNIGSMRTNFLQRQTCSKFLKKKSQHTYMLYMQRAKNLQLQI